MIHLFSNVLISVSCKINLIFIYYLIKFHILKWNHQIVRYSHCMIDFGNNSYKCFFCHVISDSKDCVQSYIDVIAMILFSLFCHIFICMNGGLLIKILCKCLELNVCLIIHSSAVITSSLLLYMYLA